MVGSLRVHFDIVLASFRAPFGVILTPFLRPFWVLFEPFGGMLARFCATFTVILHFLVAFGELTATLSKMMQEKEKYVNFCQY